MTQREKHYYFVIASYGPALIFVSEAYAWHLRSLGYHVEGVAI
jgi:hypothetical protein